MSTILSKFNLPEVATNFICLICGGISIRPMIHIGGHYQKFCQKYFCHDCVLAWASDSKNLLPSPLNNRKLVKCPDRACDRPFNSPYFAIIGGFSEIYYSKLIYFCDCGQSLKVSLLPTHWRVCSIGYSGYMKDKDGSSDCKYFGQSNSIQMLSTLASPDGDGCNVISFKASCGKIIPNFRFSSDYIVADELYKHVTNNLSASGSDFKLVFMQHSVLEKGEAFLVKDVSSSNLVANVVDSNLDLSNGRKVYSLQFLGSFPFKGFYDSHELTSRDNPGKVVVNTTKQVLHHDEALVTEVCSPDMPTHTDEGYGGSSLDYKTTPKKAKEFQQSYKEANAVSVLQGKGDLAKGALRRKSF